MKMRAKLQVPRVNHESYARHVDTRGRELTSRAIFEYLEVVQDVIPQWSGASLASFTHLANIISAPLVVNAQGWMADRPLYAAQRQEDAKSLSEAELTFTGGRYGFRYATALPHLVFNEYSNANVEIDPHVWSELITPGPYNFQQATQARVIEVLQWFVLPDPTLHIKIKRLR